MAGDQPGEDSVAHPVGTNIQSEALTLEDLKASVGKGPRLDPDDIANTYSAGRRCPTITLCEELRSVVAGATALSVTWKSPVRRLRAVLAVTV